MKLKKSVQTFAVFSLVAAVPSFAESTAQTIDFNAFLEVSAEARLARQANLIPLAEFLLLARTPEAVLIDTRSRSAYEAKHLSGAVHLNFSDFTKESLERIVGETSRPVLIYCNNNFTDNAKPFVTKAPAAALNIPTFVTLWAYGYRNIYELADLLDTADPRLDFEGQLVGEMNRPMLRSAGR